MLSQALLRHVFIEQANTSHLIGKPLAYVSLASASDFIGTAIKAAQRQPHHSHL